MVVGRIVALQGELGLHDELVQRRRRREVRVRDDARELRLDLGAVALQEQIHPARYLQVAVLLGIAVEPVEVALGLNGPQRYPTSPCMP